VLVMVLLLMVVAVLTTTNVGILQQRAQYHCLTLFEFRHLECRLVREEAVLWGDEIFYELQTITSKE
jgi:hypothetical protein